MRARTAFVSIILLFFVLRSKRLPVLQKFIFFLLIILFDFGMFASRVYLGEHWATDVVGGSLLGYALGLLSTFFLF